ncbi:hypothetical protein C882_2344 [Caenispirillum salinarum AK4]|uniref:Lipoprotein n=1 Tax=Caenispirillum salinarum AK4 TaxID=1238182 RepID=K9H3X8_9PROT|nr:hypothetical protein [Caenispirillum salinarum]EKV32267.1 hypothetical protein C882_2344 [Caenispirillum salinarum AK4]
MKRFTTPAIVLGATLVVAGCAAGTAENCDALNANSVFQDFACKQGGGYEERLALIRAETRAKVASTQLTAAETAELQAEAEVMARDADVLEDRLAGLNADLAAMRLRIDSVTARNDSQRAQLTALREELSEAEQNLAQVQAAASVTPEQIAALQGEIARKKAAVSDILGNMGVVE